MTIQDVCDRYREQSKTFYRAVESFMALQARVECRGCLDYPAILRMEAELAALKLIREELETARSVDELPILPCTRTGVPDNFPYT